MPVSSLQTALAPATHYLASAAPFLALGAFLLALLSIALILKLRGRLARLTAGSMGSIEDSINLLTKESREIKEFRAELEKYLVLAESRLRTSVRGVGVVRFNPFQNGQGGNQSFAAAFLDERGTGVVFSTLYSRDRVGVYAKPVENGVSAFELSEEEKEALKRAQESAAHKPKK